MLLAAVFAAAVASGGAVADEGIPIAGSEPTGAAAVAAGPSTPANELDTSRAQSLLSAAIAAFDAGRSHEAQMIFERLVGRFPQSAEAGSARRYLSRLYAGVAGDHAKVERVSEERGGVAEMPPAVAAPIAAPAVAVSAKADENMIPSERLSALLRSSVGDRVFFPQGSTDLGAHARSVLRGQAGWLKQQDVSVKALVAGHADEPLDAEDNTILSARRAEAVRARLIEEGIAPDRVSVMALGRTKPVADCPGPQCAAQNRRAVTVVLERREDQSQRLGSRSYFAPKDQDGPASW